MNNKKMKKVAIIGTGKLSLAAVKGFIASGMESEKIIVIGRENSSLRPFEELGIPISRDIINAREAENILLMVTPQGIGPQLVRMKEAGIERFISFASGTDIPSFSRFLGIREADIVMGTLNTNVEYGRGLIVLSFCGEREKFLDCLGAVSVERPEEIMKSIITIGSMNAIDAKALWLMFESSKAGDFRKWLLEYSPNNPLFAEYLSNKTKVLGYGSSYAKKRSVESLESTISALHCVAGDLNFEAVQEHIRKVATKGGCTEAGLFKMSDVGVLFSFERLSGVIGPIYVRAKKFENEAQQSIYAISLHV